MTADRVLLLRMRASAAGMRDAAAAGSLGGPLQLERMAWSAEQGQAYAYLRMPPDGPAEILSSRAAAFFAQMTGTSDVRASVLEEVFDVAGASSGEQALFHYVVETDIEPGWQQEIFDWYDQEHMPGLAAVPGCIRARRFINHGEGRLSLACYDLSDAAALHSPEWLAVRGTAWSSRARPHFTNTLRTMFTVPQPAGPHGT
jgi:hypothetical protein